MLSSHLTRLVGKHKMRISDMKRETGLSRKTSFTLLYKETAQKIGLDALDKLCELFNYPQSDLLERITN
ncbi:MAG: helix-turn-helix transcriptional regulator [Gammaproteobacteria bacterium]|nr:helix-turn-helix transcriptional regulator [Gammaproteobacteria bacterium]